MVAIYTLLLLKVPGDSGFSGIPQLIFVCEDEKHMAETFKNIVMNQLEIAKIKLYFTTDLFNFSCEPTSIPFHSSICNNCLEVINSNSFTNSIIEKCKSYNV